jgi:hypothetical protein
LLEIHLFFGIVVEWGRTHCFTNRCYPFLELFFFNYIFKDSWRLDNNFSISWLHLGFVMIFGLNSSCFFLVHYSLKHFEEVSILGVVVSILWLTNGYYSIWLVSFSNSRMLFGTRLSISDFKMSRFHF